MKFISDANKLAKIKELAGQGDEKAKDFLFNFMDMSDEEANAYLSSIAIESNENQVVEQENKQDIKSVLKALIDDENEAIDGYDKAIKFIANSELPDVIKTALTEKANHIKGEELEHIEEIKEMLEYVSVG